MSPLWNSAVYRLFQNHRRLNALVNANYVEKSKSFFVTYPVRFINVEVVIFVFVNSEYLVICWFYAVCPKIFCTKLRWTFWDMKSRKLRNSYVSASPLWYNPRRDPCVIYLWRFFISFVLFIYFFFLHQFYYNYLLQWCLCHLLQKISLFHHRKWIATIEAINYRARLSIFLHPQFELQLFLQLNRLE